MSDLEVTTVPGSAPEGLSQWQRVVNTFTAPSKTFEDIKRGNKSWWLPFVIFVFMGYILFAAVYMKIGMQQTVENQIQLNAKQAEAMAQLPQAQRESQEKISVYITEGFFIANPVVVLIAGLIISLVMWGTINFIFGGKAEFGGVLCVWMFSRAARHHQSAAWNHRHLRGGRAGVVQCQELRRPPTPALS